MSENIFIIVNAKSRLFWTRNWGPHARKTAAGSKGRAERSQEGPFLWGMIVVVLWVFGFD